MSKPTKNNVSFVLKLIIAVATAILGAFGTNAMINSSF